MKHHNITIEKISEALTHQLPGRSAHLRMVPAGRSLSIPEGSKNIKKSAVLMLLYLHEDQLYFCLTKRNHSLKHHPGQISFPGGRCETNETNPLSTALRETEEEIGVKPIDVNILGKLSELYIPVSNFIIHPYIGWISKKPTFNINTYEVDELITLPLHSILDEENKKTMPVETSIGSLNVPCYYINGKLIWGATSMMIAELEVILKQHYAHRATHSDTADNGPTL